MSQIYTSQTENPNFPEVVLPNVAYTLNSMALSYATHNPKNTKIAFLTADKAKKGVPLTSQETSCLRAMLRAYTSIQACEAWKPAFFETVTQNQKI